MKLPALVLAFIALASKHIPTPAPPPATRDRPNCNCGMFVELENEVHRVYTLNPADVDSCDDLSVCKEHCAIEFHDLTNGGDLNHVLENGYSVGQEICLHMVTHHGMNNIWQTKVYGYANLCDGPWVYDGESTTNNLCCLEGFYMPCQ